MQTISASKIKIKADNAGKRFGKFVVFKGVSCTVEAGKPLAVAGANGSGKSTLLEIIAQLKKPTSGTVRYLHDNAPLADTADAIGFMSPLVNAYGELSGLENIVFASRTAEEKQRALDLLNSLNLYKDKDKQTRFYSSGMKQRLKFILTVMHDPAVLIFDEPGSNLDDNGKAFVYSYITRVKQNKVIIIASNEKEELALCDETVVLAKSNQKS